MPNQKSSLLQLTGSQLPGLQQHLPNYIGEGASDLLTGDYMLTNGYYTPDPFVEAAFLNIEPDHLKSYLFKNDTHDFLFIIRGNATETDDLFAYFPIIAEEPEDDTTWYLPIVPPVTPGVVSWLYLYFSTDDPAKQKALWTSYKSAQPDKDFFAVILDFETFSSLTESETQYQEDREDPAKTPVQQKWQGGLYFQNTVTRFPFDFIEDDGGILQGIEEVTQFQFKTIGSVFHPRYNGYLVHRPVFHVRIPLEAKSDYPADSVISKTELFVEFFSKSEYSADPVEISLTGKLFLDSNKYELDITAAWPVANDLFEIICKCKIHEIPFFDHTLVPGLEGSAEAEIDVLIRISLQDKSFHSAGFIATLENWPIIPDILALKELKLSTRVFNMGASKEIFVGVDAKALLGKNGIELDCGGSYPEGQFYFALNPDTPIHLHDLAAAFFGDHGGIPEGLEITELSGQYSHSTKDVYFSIAIADTDTWSFADIKLEKIRLAVGGQGALSGSIYAGFDIGKVKFVVSADYGDGWSFDARADASQLKMADLFTKLGYSNTPDLPDFINTISIDTVELSFKSPPQAKVGDKPATAAKTEKHFKLSGSHAVNGVKIQFELKLDITYPGGTENIAFSGHVTIEDKKEKKYDFDIVQQKDGTGKLLLASYHQENPKDSIDIGELLAGLGVTDAPSMDLSLQDAFFVNDKIVKTNKSLNLFVADIGAGMNLSNLPLVGKILPKDATVSVALRVLYASAPYEDFLDNVNKTLPTAISPIVKPEVPNGKDGFDLIANINIGEHTFHLELPIETKPKEGSDISGNEPKHEITEKEPKSGTSYASSTTPSPKAAPATPGTSAAINDGITWFKIGKTFGPVVFNRIGLTYKDQKLTVYPDAALSMAGLTFTLNGLSVSSPIKEFKPTFDLKGLGLDFAEGPIEIGASFLRRPLMINGAAVLDKLGNPVYEYDGMATIKTDPFSISALGSYAYVDDHASLFIYAYLDMALGGPPFFSVEGLAAAFGYNRSLLMPTIDQVSMFPLVRQVMAGEAPDDSDPAALLTQQLDAISHYIPPSIGEMFIAIGVKFNSFKLLDSFALLAVSFGNRVEIDLLGQTNILVPSEAPPDVPPLAEIKIQLMAKFIPDEGFLGVQAQLTKDSYVLSKDCHLTGGAAFYSWFSGEHGGDFVVTLGGYHPAFNVPSHYPQVPRLGVNWQVVPELSIKGDMYFALCAHAFMAGGHLEALYESGPLKAWFKAGADFLISWQPYHYDAEIYIDLGASYTYYLFGTHQITLDLGADVHIWGPEFAGTADIHILIFDISVTFGPSGTATPDPISWDDFKQKCLPDKKELSGVIAHGQHGVDGNKIPLVNPKELTINISSPVPVETFSIPATAPPVGKTFAIAPMEVTSGISSTQKFTITQDGVQLNKTDHFIFTPVVQKLPAAIWGDSFKADLNAKDKTIPLVTGMTITTVNILTGNKIEFDKHPQEQAPFNCASVVSKAISYEPLSVQLLEELGIEMNTLIPN